MARATPSLAQATARGLATLAHEAEAGFPEAVHRMRFPAWAAWFGGQRVQVGEGFPQAVLAGVLLDIADTLPAVAGVPAAANHGHQAACWQALARRTADRLATQRSPGLQGGWRYFPPLRLLPPDLDSLAATMALFARVAPQHLPLCEGPTRLALALARQRADGASPTWLIHPQDPWAERLCMHLGVRLCWGGQRDVDVNARFAQALAWAGRPQAGEAAARHVRGQQQADGLWPRTWYACPLYTAELCLPLLAPGSAAQQAALARVASLQRADGAWPSEYRPLGDVQSTALGAWLLSQHAPQAAGTAQATQRAAAWLCQAQDNPGRWRATPWLHMAIGRAQGRVRRVARWGSATLNSALALRALLAVQALPSADHQSSKPPVFESREQRRFAGAAPAVGQAADF